MRRPLALILAAGSLAVGVPAAVATTGGGDPADPAAAASQPVQQQEQPRDRGDCPEHEGNGSGDDASATL